MFKQVDKKIKNSMNMVRNILLLIITHSHSIHSLVFILNLELNAT